MQTKRLAYARLLALFVPMLWLGCLDPVPNPPAADLRDADLTGTEIDEALPANCQTEPCPTSLPICDPGVIMCRACVEGNIEDQAACAKRNPKTKFCAARRCAECRPHMAEVDCTVGLGCVRGSCLPPEAHEDCDSDVADAYLQSGAGRCIPSAAVVYVDNKNGACVGDHAGTRADPVCTISQGLGKLGGAKSALRIYGSTSAYGAVPALSSAVSLYGPGSPSGAGKAILGNTPGVDSVSISGAADVIIDGFEVSGGKIGLRCSGGAAKVALRRAAVVGATGVGLEALGCKVTLDRTFFSGNTDGAVNFVGSATYAVTNSFFVGNVSTFNAAVRFSDESGGTFRFNTVALNNAGVPAALACGLPAVPRNIEDTIIFKNVVPAGRDSQLAGICTLKGTVVGTADKASGGIAKDPKFAKDLMPAVAADYALLDTAENRDCCIDKALGVIGNDYFGTPRGAKPDVGAHELK